MNIAEIAKLAGVSSAAVSRYFNQGYISEEKRAAIRKVVEETGYRPSVQAQTLRTKKTKMIGVILPKINSASIGSVVAGIISVLDHSGYRMLLADTQNSPERELEYLSVFNEKQVDGVIFLATVITAKHKSLLKKMPIPVVLVGQHVSGMHSVYHDDYHAVYDMTQSVLQKGRKNPAYISVMHQDKAAGAERYRGFCDAVKENGLPQCAEQYVLCDFTLDGGRQAAEALLEKCGKPDAIVCATDTIAVGAMQYIQEQGLTVPDDVAVTGIGDSVIGRVTRPAIPTVHYSYEESGVQAAQVLLELLEKEDVPVRGIMLGYRLVEC